MDAEDCIRLGHAWRVNDPTFEPEAVEVMGPAPADCVAVLAGGITEIVNPCKLYATRAIALSAAIQEATSVANWSRSRLERATSFLATCEPLDYTLPAELVPDAELVLDDEAVSYASPCITSDVTRADLRAVR